MKVAIVILNWNGKDFLGKYLPSVLKFSSGDSVRVVVADNGSSDGSSHFMAENYPSIRFIRLDRNYGFAGGYNKALTQVDAEIFCLLNSDVRVTKKWLEPVISLFDSEKTIAAIQPKILSDRDNSRFEHAGAAGGFIDQYGYPFCRGRIMNAIEYDKGQYNRQTDLFWASGACFFIRSELFMETGGFDERFFAHMEEIDLCWRLKNRGYRIVYTPESKVYHWGGATLDYDNPRKLYLNFRNSLWTFYKNYSGKHLLAVLLKRLAIDSVALVKFLFSIDLKNCMAVVRAHWAFYRSLPFLKKQRKELLKKVTAPTHREILKKSIAWQFFIRKRKTFRDLKF